MELGRFISIVIAIIAITIFIVYLCFILVETWKKAKVNNNQLLKGEDNLREKRKQDDLLFTKLMGELDTIIVEAHKEKNKYLSLLKEKNGEYDKIIYLSPKDESNINSNLYVFSKHNVILIKGKEYQFSDIIDCSLEDDFSDETSFVVRKNPSVETSKTNTTNMLGRAAIGGIVAGTTGAIIGGVTSKRETIIEHGHEEVVQNRQIIHNYTINITVKDINNPIITLNIGNDTKKKNEIMALFKVIMASTEQQ